MIININRKGEMIKTDGHKVKKEECPTAYQILRGNEWRKQRKSSQS